MKVSSISEHSLETGYLTSQQGETAINSVQKFIAAMFSAINRIGTAIALGEKGNLDAMHHFRTEKIGSK
jgi:hypothetical protein